MKRLSLLLWLGLMALLGSMPNARAGETVTLVMTDAQGTPVVETDIHGTVLARYAYRPYGTSVGGPLPAGPGYTGHVNDPDTGLVYMQQRYYDPEVGRFPSVDPVGPVPGDVFNINRYAYANNNPLRFTDPDGRNGTEALGGLFAETWSFVTGNGFHGGQIVGALKDGYNGEGGGVVNAALQDANTIAVATGVAGIVKGGATLVVSRFAAKKAAEEVAEIGGKSVAEAAESQGPRFARGKLRQQVMDKGRQADGSIQCKYCGKPTATQSDHVVPYSKGGPTKIENLEPACASCNASKGAKDLGTEWTPPKDRLEQ